MSNEMMSDEEYLDSLLNKVYQPEKKEEDEPAELFEKEPEEDESAEWFEKEPEEDESAEWFEKEPEEDESAEWFEKEPKEDEPVELFEDKQAEEPLFDVGEMPDFFDLERMADEVIATQGNKESTGDNPSQSSNNDEEDLLASLDSIVQEIKGEYEQDTMPDFLDLDMNIESDAGEEQQKHVIFDDIDDELLDGLNEEKKKNKKEKNKKEKKSAFLNKMGKLFFKVEIIAPEEQEKFENERMRLQLEKEEEKKAKAEEDQKKAEEKKEEKKQKKEAAKEQKRLKEEAKAKAKAEKPVKPREPEEILKVRPIFVLFLLSIMAAIVIMANTLSEIHAYNNSVKSAQDYLMKQKYAQAYKELLGMELKETDLGLYAKIKVLIRLEKQYESYLNFTSLQMPAEALDSLVKGVNIYDSYKEAAGSLEVLDEYDAIYGDILYALSNSYGLNEEQGIALANMKDSGEYARQILEYSGGNP